MQAVRVTTTAPTRPTAPRALPIEVAAAAYFALQAVLGALLWIGVGTADVVRSWLELVPERTQVTNAFLPADIVVIVASALAAWALWRGRSWAMVPVMFTVGGVVYPTVYLIGWVTTTEGTGEVALEDHAGDQRDELRSSPARVAGPAPGVTLSGRGRSHRGCCGPRAGRRPRR